MKRDERRGPGRPKRMERQEVLEFALAEYWREGVLGLSLNEICRRISLSKPSLYREFGSEDGLVNAVLEHYRDTVIAPMFDYLLEDRPFRETMSGLIAALSVAREDLPGCLFTKMRLSQGGLGPQTKATLRAMERERRAAFASCYQRAQAQNEARDSISPERAARYIDAQFSMLLLHLGMGDSAAELRENVELAMAPLWR